MSSLHPFRPEAGLPAPTSAEPTLDAVARRAGVSRSTASRALHGHPYLARATVQRVRAAALAVGYHANPLVSNVMRRVRSQGTPLSLGTLAYLTFHDTPDGWRDHPTYGAFVAGARSRAGELGFSLDLVWAVEPRLTPERLGSILRNRGVGGLIVGPRLPQCQSVTLDWSQFAVASVGRPLPNVVLHQSASHYLRMMERLLAILEERGYERIGLALGRSNVPATDHGWIAALDHYQASIPLERRIPTLVVEPGDEFALPRWVVQHRPDVVIGQRDDVVEHQLPQLGLRIPEEIGYALLSRPSVEGAPAGIDQMPRLIGAGAVDLVANQLFSGERGVPEHPRFVLVEGVWRDGPTVRAPGGATRNRCATPGRAG